MREEGLRCLKVGCGQYMLYWDSPSSALCLDPVWVPPLDRLGTVASGGPPGPPGGRTEGHTTLDGRNWILMLNGLDGRISENLSSPCESECTTTRTKNPGGTLARAPPRQAETCFPTFGGRPPRRCGCGAGALALSAAAHRRAWRPGSALGWMHTSRRSERPHTHTSGAHRHGAAPGTAARASPENLVDPASSHMLRSRAKPCMSQRTRFPQWVCEWLLTSAVILAVELWKAPPARRPAGYPPKPGG